MDTLLVRKVLLNNTDAVRKLVSGNIDLDFKGRGGKTALYIACDHGFIDIVKILLDAGADTKVENDIGWLPIDIAAFRGRLDIVDVIKHHEYEMSKLLVL